MFYFGSSYYLPHHSEEEWEVDFARMKEFGHNCIRTGELLATWDLYEKEPGKPDFRWLDNAFELATKNGLKVLLGTGACCPPGWLVNENPDLPIQDRDGNNYPPGAMWGWACINHPAYLKESDRYLRQLLERYSSHEALMGWQIHNEPAYPFIPQEDKAEPDWYDYNPYTVAQFRVWLEEKYQDIDKLNTAWLWDPTNIQYRNFQEIDAPRRSAAEWAVPLAWLDWRTFTYDNWNSLIQRQNDLIKTISPDLPTMTNLMGDCVDRTGRLAVDAWKLPKAVDAIGYDLYPGQHVETAKVVEREVKAFDYASWFLTMAWSTAKHHNKPLWLPEAESGPLVGWIKGPHYSTTGADIRRWGLQTIAHGAKMILYQGYRDWNVLPLHWGALVDWHGEPTERLYASEDLAKLVTDHNKVIENAIPVQAKIGLFYDQRATVFNASASSGDYNENAMIGMHDILRQIGISAEYVNPEFCSPDMPYDVLVLPFSTMISQATSDAIAGFVKKGGKLISMPRSGMVNENAHVWSTRPGGSLSDVLGLREVEIMVADDPEIQFGPELDNVLLPGFHHVQKLKLGSDTRVMATFENNLPALTSHKYGEGEGIHFATHFELASAKSPAHVELWRKLFEYCGVIPEVQVHSSLDAETISRLDTRLMNSGDSMVLILCNDAKVDISCELAVDDYPFTKQQNLMPGIGDCSLETGGAKTHLVINIPAKEGMAILLDK